MYFLMNLLSLLVTLTVIPFSVADFSLKNAAVAPPLFSIFENSEIEKDHSLILNSLVFDLPVNFTKADQFGLINYNVSLSNIVCKNATLTDIESGASGTQLTGAVMGIGVKCLSKLNMKAGVVKAQGSLWFILEKSNFDLGFDVDKNSSTATCTKCAVNLKVKDIGFDIQNKFLQVVLNGLSGLLKNSIASRISSDLCSKAIRPAIKKDLSALVKNTSLAMDPYLSKPPSASLPVFHSTLYNFFDSEIRAHTERDLAIVGPIAKSVVNYLTNKTGYFDIPPAKIQEFFNTSGFNFTQTVLNSFTITPEILSLKIGQFNSISNVTLLSTSDHNQTLKSRMHVGKMEIFSRVSLDVIPIYHDEKFKRVHARLKKQVLDLHFELTNTDLEMDVFLGLDKIRTNEFIRTKTFSKGCIFESILGMKVINLLVDISSQKASVIDIRPVSGDIVEPQLVKLINDFVLFGTDLFGSRLGKALHGFIGGPVRDQINHNMTDFIKSLDFPVCHLNDHKHHNNPTIILNHLDFHLPDIHGKFQDFEATLTNSQCQKATFDKVSSSSSLHNYLQINAFGLGVNCSTEMHVRHKNELYNGSAWFAINDVNMKLGMTIDPETGNTIIDDDDALFNFVVEGIHVNIEQHSAISEVLNDITIVLSAALNSNLQAIETKIETKVALKSKLEKVIETAYNEVNGLFTPFLPEPTPATLPALNTSLYNLVDSQIREHIERDVEFLYPIVDYVINGLTNKTGYIDVPVKILKDTLNITEKDLTKKVLNSFFVTLDILSLKIGQMNSLSDIKVFAGDDQNQTLKSSLNIGNIEMTTRISLDVRPISGDSNVTPEIATALKTQVLDIHFKLKDVEVAMDIFLGLDDYRTAEWVRTKTLTEGCLLQSFLGVKIINLLVDLSPEKNLSFDIQAVSGDAVEPELAKLINDSVLFGTDLFGVRIGKALHGFIGSIVRDQINDDISGYVNQTHVLPECHLNKIHTHHNNPSIVINHLAFHLPDMHRTYQGVGVDLTNIECLKATVDHVSSSFMKDHFQIGLLGLGINCSAEITTSHEENVIQSSVYFVINDVNFKSGIEIDPVTGIVVLDDSSFDLYVEDIHVDIDLHSGVSQALNDLLVVLGAAVNSNLQIMETKLALKSKLEKAIQKAFNVTTSLFKKYLQPPRPLVAPYVNQSVAVDLYDNSFLGLLQDNERVLAAGLQWIVSEESMIELMAKLVGWKIPPGLFKYMKKLLNHKIDRFDVPSSILRDISITQDIPQIEAHVTFEIEKVAISGLTSLSNVNIFNVSDDAKQVLRNSFDIGDLEFNTVLVLNVQPYERNGQTNQTDLRKTAPFPKKQVLNLDFHLKNTSVLTDFFLAFDSDVLTQMSKSGTISEECFASSVISAKFLNFVFDGIIDPNILSVTVVSGDSELPHAVKVMDDLSLFVNAIFFDKFNAGLVLRGILGTVTRDTINAIIGSLLSERKPYCQMLPYVPRHVHLFNHSLLLNHFILRLPNQQLPLPQPINVDVENILCKNITLLHADSSAKDTAISLKMDGLSITCSAEIKVNLGIVSKAVGVGFTLVDDGFSFGAEIDIVNNNVSVTDCALDAYFHELEIDLGEIDEKLSSDLNKVISLTKNGLLNALALDKKICGDISLLEDFATHAYKDFYNKSHSEFMSIPASASPISGVSNPVDLYNNVWMDLFQSGLTYATPYVHPLILNLTNNTGDLEVPSSVLTAVGSSTVHFSALDADVSVALESLLIRGLGSFNNITLGDRTLENEQTLINHLNFDTFGVSSRVVLDFPSAYEGEWDQFKQTFDVEFYIENASLQLNIFLDLNGRHINDLVTTKTSTAACFAQSLFDVKLKDNIFFAEFPMQFLKITPVNVTDKFLPNLIDNTVLFSEDVLQEQLSTTLRWFLGSTLRDQVNSLIHDQLDGFKHDNQCMMNAPPDLHQHLSDVGLLGVVFGGFVLLIVCLGMARYHVKRGNYELTVLRADNRGGVSSEQAREMENNNNGNNEEDHDDVNILSVEEENTGSSSEGNRKSNDEIDSEEDTGVKYDRIDDEDVENILIVESDETALLPLRDSAFTPSHRALCQYYTKGKTGMFLQFILPALIFITFGLRIYSISADVCTIHFSVNIENQEGVFKDELVVFTFKQLIHDFWKSKAYLIAILIVLGSAVLPIIKHIFMLVAWWVPMKSIYRGHTLFTLDQISKGSFVDVMFLSYIVDVFRRTAVHGILTVNIVATPNQGVMAGMTSIACSIILGQFMTYLHHKQLREERSIYLAKHDLIELPQEKKPKSFNFGKKRYIGPIFHSILMFLILLNIVGFVVGFTGDFMHFQVGGLASLFLDPTTLNSSFTLVNVLEGLIYHTDVKPQAYYTTFYLFLLIVVVPIIFFVVSFINLVIRPLFFQSKSKLYSLCETLQDTIYFLGAWCGYEVLWIASLATQLEINQIAQFAIQKNLGFVDDLKKQIPELCNRFVKLEGLPFDIHSFCTKVESFISQDTIVVSAQMTSSAWWMLGSALACIGFVLIFQKYDWKYHSQPLPFPSANRRGSL